MDTDPIKEIRNRTERYWYQDGIWEIGFGLVNLLLGAFYWFVSQGNWQGPMALVLLFLQAGVIIGAFLGINRLVKLLKERITYPRTGYVAYRRPPTSQRVRRALLAGLIAAGTAALIGVVSAIQMAPNRMPIIAGLAIAAALVYIGHRFHLLRMYLIAALTILIGVAVSAASLPEITTSMVFFSAFGLMMVLSGLAVMMAYLRSTRPATPDMDYDAPPFLGEEEPPRRDR